MKITLIVFALVVLVGCQSSRRIKAEQAGELATQLANDKADAVYHRRPFVNKQPAHFEAGRWTWTDMQGVGTLDFHATVELAANGSTNSVDVKVSDDALHRTIYERAR